MSEVIYLYLNESAPYRFTWPWYKEAPVFYLDDLVEDTALI